MKTIFVLQAFRGRPGRLEPVQLRQFGTETDALERAEKVRERAAGCRVFRISGDPATDCWSAPEVLMECGLVPPLAA